MLPLSKKPTAFHVALLVVGVLPFVLLILVQSVIMCPFLQCPGIHNMTRRLNPREVILPYWSVFLSPPALCVLGSQRTCCTLSDLRSMILTKNLVFLGHVKVTKTLWSIQQRVRGNSLAKLCTCLVDFPA